MKNVRELLYHLLSRFNALYATVMGVKATGFLTVAGQVVDAETIIVNGLTLTFRDITSDPEFEITASDIAFDPANTPAQDALAISAVLNDSPDEGALDAAYDAIGSVVRITAKEVGTGGNAFTLANSSGSHVTRSAATLTGGVDSYETRIAALE